MKIYIDLILLLNFAFDFILLLSVSILLRRCADINRLILGAFFGSLSVLLLFIKINSLELFIIKILISIFMILISFGFRNIKYFGKNIGYLYMSSIVLGGFLYFLNLQFSYKNDGLVFYFKGLSINFIFLIIFSPIIIYIYVRQGIKLKNNYSKYHKLSIYLDDELINCVGYIDTGNKIVDPYLKRNIIFINKNYIKNQYSKRVLVPYQTISDSGILKCIKIKRLKIDGHLVNKAYLLSEMNEKIEIDGVDCIMPEIEEENLNDKNDN